MYYRDEIGNISTSHLREDEDFVELELTPRLVSVASQLAPYLSEEKVQLKMLIRGQCCRAYLGSNTLEFGAYLCKEKVQLKIFSSLN